MSSGDGENVMRKVSGIDCSSEIILQGLISLHTVATWPVPRTLICCKLSPVIKSARNKKGLFIRNLV